MDFITKPLQGCKRARRGPSYGNSYRADKCRRQLSGQLGEETAEPGESGAAGGHAMHDSVPLGGSAQVTVGDP